MRVAKSPGTLLWIAVRGLALALVLAVSSRVSAQETERAGQKVALLVGINEYEKRHLRNLRYAERDVEQLHSILRKAGYRVVLLTGSSAGRQRATLTNIQNAIEAVLRGRTKKDLVLVALAGHGLQVEVAGSDGRRRTESFFCPTDAERGNPKTMLGISRLISDIDHRGGGWNLVLVDACREDPTRGRGLDGSTVKVPEGVAVLFGCRSGQRTFESDQAGGGHGVFFHFVLEALRGKAENGKGQVTWNGLVEYVQGKVYEKVGQLLGESTRQEPNHIANLQGRMPALVSIAGDGTAKEATVRVRGGDWSMFGSDAGNSFCNSTENVLRPPLTRLWTTSASATSLGGLTVADGIVLTAGQGRGNCNVVSAFDGQTGELRWEFALTGGGKGAMSVSPAVFNGSAFFTGQDDNMFYALDLKTGKVKWRSALDGKGFHSNSPKLNQGSVLIGANARWPEMPLLAFDARTGRTQWRMEGLGRPGDLAISNTVLLVSSVYPEPLKGVDVATGKVLWKSRQDCAGCVTASSGVAFAPVAQPGREPIRKCDRIVAINTENGQQLWQASFEDDFRYARMTLLNGVLFVASAGDGNRSTLYALDPKTGRVFGRRAGFSRIGRLVSANGVVYASMYQEDVYALDPGNLQTKWRAGVRGGQDLAVAHGRLYVASSSRLLCFGNRD